MTNKRCPTGSRRHKKSGECVKKTQKKHQEKPCPQGKHLNPATNRCKNVTQVKPCASGKVRNPTTNRCRSVKTKVNVTPRPSKTSPKKTSHEKTSPKSIPSHHTLIASGGQGCIFKPYIPCHKKSKSKSKHKHKTISKISFHASSAKHEFKMDEVIRKIPDHSKWAVLWDTYCKTPSFNQLKTTSDIEKCLDKKNVTYSSSTTFPMLIGPFAGKSLYEYGEDIFTKSSFTSQKSFDSCLHKLIQPLHNIFFGLTQLATHNLSHADLTVRNVLISNSESFLIDFGLAYRWSNTSYIKRHLRFLFERTDRIYDSYPYDYYLYHSHINKSQLRGELRDMDNDIMREYHDDYQKYHGVVLGREYINEQLAEYMNLILANHKPNLNIIIKALDTYSVGMLVPIILHDRCDDLKVSFKTLKERCANSTHSSFFDLCRDMTEFYSEDRISPKEAYQRYQDISK